MNFTPTQIRELTAAQCDEATESGVYRSLAEVEKDAGNKAVLLKLASEEAAHAGVLQGITQTVSRPDMKRINRLYWTARILGITFAIKLMEGSEQASRAFYANYPASPELQQMAEDEAQHEQQLIGMINEERLEYMGSVVLGLNDALVEFTGALAGFTLALGSTPLIALTGSITGIAAALSMASSEYLSTKSENSGEKHPVKAAVYTGIAYLFTVVALVAPFMLISNALVALAVMLAMALLIIALFNYYYSVAKGESFRKRFAEMAILSFSVAGVSFLIGYLLKLFTGIET